METRPAPRAAASAAHPSAAAPEEGASRAAATASASSRRPTAPRCLGLPEYLLVRHPPIQITDTISLACIEKTHFDRAIELCEQVIKTDQRYGRSNVFKIKMRVKASPRYSIVMLDNETVIGGYFFQEESNILHEFGLTRKKLLWAQKNLNNIRKEKRNMVRTLIAALKRYSGEGIEGVALFLHKDYRSRGLGRYLIEYPYEHLNKVFSHIWGGQEKDLNNIMDWLKRRELIYDTGRCFYTIGSLNRQGDVSKISS